MRRLVWVATALTAAMAVVVAVYGLVDDGTRLPAAPRAGVGLSSMRECAAELGGTCEVGPAPGGGTLVRARPPVAPRLGQWHSRPGLAGDEALGVLVDGEADQRRDAGDAPQALRLDLGGEQLLGGQDVVRHGGALDQVGLLVDERVQRVAVDEDGFARRVVGHAGRLPAGAVTCPAGGVTGACRSPQRQRS